MCKIRHYQAKKAFNQQLKVLEREYDDDQIKQAVLTAEVDRNTFWRMLKTSRESKNRREVLYVCYKKWQWDGCTRT